MYLFYLIIFDEKSLLLTSSGSFWWGYGSLYFEYISFIGHIELVVHRCLWTAVMLVLTITLLSKWKHLN